MKPANAWFISRAIFRRVSRWSSGSQLSSFGDHPVPVDENIEGDDGRDDQERQEIEQRGSARHERL